jgi:quercetin dioxygenase-like cupin family protein
MLRTGKPHRSSTKVNLGLSACRRSLTLLSLLMFYPAACAWALEPGAGVVVKPILKAGSSWNGAPIAYPEGRPEITGQIVELQPGAETGWHQHPVPSFGLIMEGELEVSLQDGTKKLLKAGDSVIEVVNTPHNGRSVGKVPVKLMVFYTGTVGKATTLKETPQARTSVND